VQGNRSLSGNGLSFKIISFFLGIGFLCADEPF